MKIENANRILYCFIKHKLEIIISIANFETVKLNQSINQIHYLNFT